MLKSVETIRNPSWLVLTVTPAMGGEEWLIYATGDGLFELCAEQRAILLGDWIAVCGALKAACVNDSGNGTFYLIAEREVQAAMMKDLLSAGATNSTLNAGSELRMLVLPHPTTARPVALRAGVDEDDLDDFTPLGAVLLDYSWQDDMFLGTTMGHLLVDIGDGLAVSWPTEEATGWSEPEIVELGGPGDERATAIADWCVKNVSQGTGVLGSVVVPFNPSRRLSESDAEAWKELLDDSRWILGIDIDDETLTALRLHAVPALIQRAFADPTSSAGVRLKKMLVDSSIHDLDVEGSLPRTDIEIVRRSTEPNRGPDLP